MLSFPFRSRLSKEQSAPPPPAPPVLAPSPVEPVPKLVEPPTKTPIFSSRSVKQLGLFFAGAGFLTFSTLITRRAVTRKQIAALPKFYQQSHSPMVGKGHNPDGPFIAFEALNLATLNVISFGIMATGGVSFAFDISSLEDLRKMARRNLDYTPGVIDEQAEREIEEWVSKVILKREKGADGSTDQPKRND